MQDFQKAFNDEIELRLKAQSFPVDAMPEHFFAWVAMTLEHESKATLGVDQDTFQRLHDYANYRVQGPVTLYDMGCLLNAIERRTQREWNGADYCEVMAAQTAMSHKWNEIVNPIKQAIMNKLQTQARISKGVPAGKQIIGKA